MSRSSGRRGQLPVVALVAVAVVGLALGVYAGVLDRAGPAPTTRATAEITVDRAVDVVAPAGVARPASLGRAQSVRPGGYDANVSLAVGGERWSVGPPVPSDGDADVAVEPVSVRVAPGRIRSGRLRVVVWQ